MSLSESRLHPQPLPGEFADALGRARVRLGLFARPPLWYSEVNSTNDVAAALAVAGARSGTVVLADTQFAGRGRHGRSWSSPPGAGLYVSILLRPGAVVPPLLTLAAGVALAEGMQAASGLNPQLKWPNDVLFGGRKLAGILAESCLQPEGVAPAIVLGIGINVRASLHTLSVKEIATSLEEELDRKVDRGLLLAECLVALATRYADLQGGRATDVLTAWRARADLGRPVEWKVGGRLCHGVAETVDETGALAVRTDGGLVLLTSSEVRWT